MSCADSDAAESPPPPVVSEATSAPRPARAQLVDGRPVWPEHWGLERRQVAELLQRLREDEAWEAKNDVYCLVKDFIVPWTRGSGLSYALQLNGRAPKEVNLMVSHAWAENAEAFLEALLRASTEEDVLFVCALSIYQAEDGCGPSIAEQLGSEPGESPFRRVLQHIRARGKASRFWWRFWLFAKAMHELIFVTAVVLFYLPSLWLSCVPMLRQCAKAKPKNSDLFFLDDVAWQAEPLAPRWRLCMPVALALMLAMRLWRLALRRMKIYRGRMVVVPNGQVDVYSRLWCVYEIFVARSLGVPVRMARSLCPAGFVRCRHAVCGSQRDAARIRGEMDEGGYSCEHIDKVVYLVTCRARAECLRTLLTYGVSAAVANAAWDCMKDGYDSRAQEQASIVPEILGIFVGLSCVRVVFQRFQGRPSFRTVCVCGFCLLMLGVRVSEDVQLTQLDFFRRICRAVALIGADILVLTCVSVCCCTERLKENYRDVVLPLCTLGAVALLQLGKSPPPEYIYPSLVHSATFILVHFWLPAQVWWSSALHWGASIELDKRSRTCAHAVRAVWKRGWGRDMV